MIPIATDDDLPLPLCKLEDDMIRRRGRQNLAQSSHLVLPISDQLLHLIRHIVVEQELHYKVSLICSVTSASISVRWSS